MKHNLFVKIVFIQLVLVSFCFGNNWIDVVKSELEKLKTNEPSETG